MTKVHIIAGTTAGGQALKPGDCPELSDNEARTLIAFKMAEPYAGQDLHARPNPLDQNENGRPDDLTAKTVEMLKDIIVNDYQATPPKGATKPKLIEFIKAAAAQKKYEARVAELEAMFPEELAKVVEQQKLEVTEGATPEELINAILAAEFGEPDTTQA